MAERDERIADLEREMERLFESAEWSRKTAILGRAAAWGGAALLGMLLLGLVRGSGEVLAVAIACALGGVALAGTSRSTRDEIMERIRACEAKRGQLIDAMDLRVVAGDVGAEARL